MLKLRLLTALLLGGAFLGALFLLPDVWWGLFLLLFMALGAWEWAGLAGWGSGGRVWFTAATTMAGLLLVPELLLAAETVHALHAALICVAAVFWLLLAPPWLLRRWRLHGVWLAAMVGWLLLLAPLVALLQLRGISPFAVLLVMATVWLADSAAYFCGRRYGRHKLAPQISPGKTWEGLLGALAAVAVAAAALTLWQGWSAWFIPGALAIVVFAVFGDLFESLIKRQAGCKDSGWLLPGHGGVLDRIDALMPTLPLAAFYVYFPAYYSFLAGA